MRAPAGSSNRSARSRLENSPAAAPSGVTLTVCAPAAWTLQKTHPSTATDHRACLVMASSSLPEFPFGRPSPAGYYIWRTALGTKFLSLRWRTMEPPSSDVESGETLRLLRNVADALVRISRTAQRDAYRRRGPAVLISRDFSAS